ncbi:hypothetical protein FRC08_015963 [Ceratobasidium sp. 394]|nr:hypothetical protein FRC08_015963 [Ceratobasidium sp. 394]
MIQLAKTFRQAEKNTPPDFTTTPPTNRNSVFCQRPSRNPELIGLNQKQVCGPKCRTRFPSDFVVDPANDPDIFFDPACKCSVKKGSQANTSPLGGNANSGGAVDDVVTSAPPNLAAPTEIATATTTETAALVTTAAATSTDVVATATEVPSTCPTVVTVTVTVGPAGTEVATETAASTTAIETSIAVSSAAPPAATNAPPAGALPAGVDLGSCTDPTIRFGAGIEGSKETSFIPNNTKEFAHGSAQNSAIITQFICDTFVNSCKANAAAVALCADAKAAAAAAGAKKGAAAGAFNAQFGVTTAFASVQALDDQGNPVP